MPKHLTNLENTVLSATKKIPRGRVATYSGVARFIKRPKAVRAVGNALNKNPFAPKVPCHRVVKSDGRLGGFAGGAEKKARLLEQEGVKIKAGKIVNFQDALYSL